MKRLAASAFSALTRAGGLVALVLLVALSLTLGMWIPENARALPPALAVATAAAIVLVPGLSGRWRGRRADETGPEAEAAEPESRPYLLPRELPETPRGFVGRARELALLAEGVTRHRGPGPYVAVIHGEAGIGKSAMAVVLAHRLTHRFPDGQLYVRAEHTVDELVAYFLRVLKRPDEPIPGDASMQRAKYAELTADRRVLIVLDDVPASMDVTGLFPAGAGCALVVTTRRAPGWPGVTRSLQVSPLPDDEALDVLRGVLGADRVAGELDEAEQLVRQCDGRPLALRAAGTALAHRPNWEIKRVVEQTEWLSRRSGGSLDAAYAMLTADEQRALRAVRVLGTAEFAPWMLAAALGVDDARGGRLAARLAAAGLLDPHSPGSGTPSYRARDVVVEYARLRARAEDGRGATRDREDALRARVRERLRLGLHTARIGELDALLREYGAFQPAIEAVRNVMASARERKDRDEEAAACGALAELYCDLGDLVAAEDLAGRALRVGEAGRPARALLVLARVERRRNRLAAARDPAGAALSALAVTRIPASGTLTGEPSATSPAVPPDSASRTGSPDTYGDGLGSDPRSPVEPAEHTAGPGDDVPPLPGDSTRERSDAARLRVRLLAEKALILAALGEHAPAEAAAAEALNRTRALDPGSRPAVEAETGWYHGTVLLLAHRYGEAVEVLGQAGKDAKNHGQPWYAAWIGETRAAAALGAGDPALAEACARAALETFAALRHRYGKAHCHHRLGLIHLAAGRPGEAAAELRQALEVFGNCGDRWVESETTLRLAQAHRMGGRPWRAVRLQYAAAQSRLRLGDRAGTRRAAGEMARTLLGLSSSTSSPERR